MQSEQLHKIKNNFVPKIKSMIDHIWTNFLVEQCHVNISHSYWSDHDATHDLQHYM